MLHPSKLEIILKDVEHNLELTEYQNAVAIFLQLGQELVEQHQLSGRPDEKVCLSLLFISNLLGRSHLLLHAIKKERMVAALA